MGQLVPVLLTRMVRLTSPLHSLFGERAAAGECASSALCGGPLRSPEDSSPNGSRNMRRPAAGRPARNRSGDQSWQPGWDLQDSGSDADLGRHRRESAKVAAAQQERPLGFSRCSRGSRGGRRCIVYNDILYRGEPEEDVRYTVYIAVHNSALYSYIIGCSCTSYKCITLRAQDVRGYDFQVRFSGVICETRVSRMV